MEEQIEKLENKVIELENRITEMTNLLREHKHEGLETSTLPKGKILGYYIVLDSKTSAPSAINGGIYFNSSTSRFQVCQDGSTWVNVWTD